MSTRREFLTQATAATLVASATTAPPAEAQGKSTASALAAAAKPAGPMKTYTVPHTDLVVSRLAYGNAMLGFDRNSQDFIPQTLATMRAAVDQGITLFDTADVRYSLLRAAVPIEQHT